MTMQVLGFHIPTEIMDIVAMIEKVNEIGMDLVIQTLHSVQPIQWELQAMPNLESTNEKEFWSA